MNTISETYQDVERFILSRVNLFQNKFGGDFSEMLSAANVGFMAAFKGYNPKKGYRFVTYAGKAIWREMIQENRNEHKRKPAQLSNADRIPSRREFNFDSFLSELSGDARTIVKLVINYDLLTAKIDPEIVRGTLSQDLLSMGWNQKRISESFRELKESFS